MSLKGQAALSAVFACVTRGLGFALRIVLGHLMGPQAMGMMEMAGGVQQMFMTMVVSGLPVAVSRQCAMEKKDNRGWTLYAARRMAARRGLAMMVLCIASAPFAGLVLGDMRVLPALLVFAPALPIVSVCAVMDGCAYGYGRAFFPAVSECLEQVVRIMASGLMLLAWPNLTLPFKAAVPVFAGVLGEGAGLWVMVVAFRGRGRPSGHEKDIEKQLDRIALPILATRMGSSALRSVSSLLLPRLLGMYGRSAVQAASDIGFLQGMVMPLLFLPGIVTGAFATLGGPQMAARSGKSQKRLAMKLTALSACAGAGGAALLYALSPVIGEKIYRQSAVSPLLRRMSIGALLIALNHILSAMLMGLGRQKALMKRQMLSGALTLLLTVFFTVHYGIFGAGAAMLTGQMVQCVLLAWLLLCTLRSGGSKASGVDAKYSPIKA